MRAAIYVRVSKDEQTRNFSLPTQRAACQEYAAANGMTVVAELADDETGATLSRSGMAELRGMVQAHQIDAVIVYGVDRLHRDLVNQVLIRREIQRAGVAIHYVRRGELKDTPEDRFTDNIEAAVAEYERERIRERTMRGTQGKVKAGKVPGGGLPKYGYTYEGSGRERELVIDPAQAAIVREIHERYGAGENVRAIQVDLTERQVPTWADLHGGRNRKRRQPGAWDQGTIYDILRDEAYAGTYQAFRNVVRDERQQRRPPAGWVAVPCPAIISRELWEANQQQLDAGRKLSPRGMRRFYLLRQRLRCGVCGGALVGATQMRANGREHRYYKCVNRDAATALPCDLPYVPGPRADAEVWATVRALYGDQALVLQGLERLQAQAAAAAEQQHETQADLSQQLSGVQQRIDRLLDRLSQLTSVDPRDIERQLAPLNAQRADIERRLAASAAAPVDPPPPALVQALTEQYDAFQRGLERAEQDPEAQQRVIELCDVRATIVRRGHQLIALVTTPIVVEPATCILRDDLV